LIQNLGDTIIINYTNAELTLQQSTAVSTICCHRSWSFARFQVVCKPM